MTFFSIIQEGLLLYVGILGLLIGSFLNVVIWRLPKILAREWEEACVEYVHELRSGTLPHTPSQEISAACLAEPTITAGFDPDSQWSSLVYPGSHCPVCEHTLSFWENIPVVSYLLLRGRCTHCRSAISFRYPLVELCTAFFSVLTAYHFGLGWPLWYALLFTWSLIALAGIDFRVQLLPDQLTLPLLWIGLLANMQGYFVDLPSAVLGAILGYLFLFSLYWSYKLVTHKEGMGQGDFKLLSMLGAYVGWQALPTIILLSSCMGLLAGISLRLRKRLAAGEAMPFGPYLALGGWLSLIFGDKLSSWYFSLW